MLCGERGLTADEAQFVGDAIELLTHEDMREIHSLITHRGASRATKVDVIRPTLDVDRAGPQHALQGHLTRRVIVEFALFAIFALILIGVVGPGF